MITIYLKGFASGASLIIAIGAQNAFVLSQGIRKNYIILVPLICSICDVALLSCGIMGIGKIVGANKAFQTMTALFGGIFLFFYGLTSFYSALKGKRLDKDYKKKETMKKVVLSTLGITLLNPHVYLDTVVIMGSISSQFPAELKPYFGAGAISASFIWFFGLSLGASFMKPLFQKEISWKVLDFLVGITMWAIGFTLVKNLL